MRHRRIADVDAPLLREELQQDGRVNLYSVLLGHNSEGDGMSLLSSFGWQRDEVSPLAFGIGSGRRTTR